MAGAAVVAGELRREHQKDEREDGSRGQVFPTPARTGWGHTAATLYPHSAQVIIQRML